MNINLLEKTINNASPETCANALKIMLTAHAFPVFGGAKTIEHEVAAIRALQQIGFIPESPDEYDLIRGLRVTRVKARSLLYQVALRSELSSEQIDASLRNLLCNPRVMKDGDAIFIDVPEPLLMDFLRQRVRKANYLSDGSFSGSIAKLPVDALIALVAELMPKGEQPKVMKKLRERGVRGNDLPSLVGAAIGQLGKRVAGHAGEKIAENIGDKLADFLEKGAAAAFDWIEPGVLD